MSDPILPRQTIARPGSPSASRDQVAEPFPKFRRRIAEVLDGELDRHEVECALTEAAARRLLVTALLREQGSAGAALSDEARTLEELLQALRRRLDEPAP